MFSQRWSTFSLVGIASMAASSFFFIGRISVHDRLAATGKGTSGALSAQVQAKDFRKTAAAIDPCSQPETEEPKSAWARLSAEPRTPATEAEMTAAIGKMAEHDAQGAIQLAQAESNFRLRTTMLRAALQGWGKTDPDAATAWVQSQTVMDRDQAASALLQGVVQNPDKAANVTAVLMQNDPGHAAQYGSDLIWAFADSGQFSEAANFAANGAENNRADWMLAAYSRWAEFQPQSAVSSAVQLQDPDLQQTALNAVIVGWSPTDPQGMAEFALKNLSTDQQNTALSRALAFWADSDPAAAATWINQKKPGAASDVGVAEIAMSPQLAQTPDLAANWAKIITDPNLRSRTLAAVLQTWARSNPTAVRHYLETSSDVQADDLSNLLAEMNNP
jgi:hypothetical protein